MNSNNQGGSRGRSKSNEEIIKQIATGNYGNNILSSWKTQIKLGYSWTNLFFVLYTISKWIKSIILYKQ